MSCQKALWVCNQIKEKSKHFITLNFMSRRIQESVWNIGVHLNYHVYIFFTIIAIIDSLVKS